MSPPRILRDTDIALLAAMGHGTVPVRRKPDVAIMMTGDEIVPAGGGRCRRERSTGRTATDSTPCARLPGHRRGSCRSSRDDAASLRDAVAFADGADLILTIGGASVGDHDLVADTLASAGMDLAFHGVRMRPGKPLLGGMLGGAAVVGLPGNPVSAMVCGWVFVRPVLNALLGCPSEPDFAMRPLARPLDGNGAREHYMRATTLPDGTVQVTSDQDSSLLSVLAGSDCLIRREPDAPMASAGSLVPVLDHGRMF